MLSFPEIIPAVAIMVCGPLWGIRLALHGFLLQACALWIATACGAIGFTRFLKTRNLLGVYLTTGLLLALALLVHWTLPSTERFFN